ncbi:MAG: hypothetical protein U0359_13200 [Byssovorax sp.]
MATKFEDFLKEKKIDSRRLLAASAEIEHFRPEDRKIRLDKRLARKGDDAAKKKEAAAKKPRSGRPVTARALSAALTGKNLSGPSKSRILRAVNYLLAQKKSEAVELAALFDPTPRPVKAKKAE